MMEKWIKGAAKATGAAYSAIGLFAVGSMIVSGAAIGAAVGTYKYAKNAVQKALDADQQHASDAAAPENNAGEADAD